MGNQVQKEKMRPLQAEATVWAQMWGVGGGERHLPVGEGCGKGRYWGWLQWVGRAGLSHGQLCILIFGETSELTAMLFQNCPCL